MEGRYLFTDTIIVKFDTIIIQTGTVSPLLYTGIIYYFTA
jgi:hypothetical protein